MYERGLFQPLYIFSFQSLYKSEKLFINTTTVQLRDFSLNQKSTRKFCINFLYEEILIRSFLQAAQFHSVYEEESSLINR